MAYINQALKSKIMEEINKVKLPKGWKVSSKIEDNQLIVLNVSVPFILVQNDFVSLQTLKTHGKSFTFYSDEYLSYFNTVQERNLPPCMKSYYSVLIQLQEALNLFRQITSNADNDYYLTNYHSVMRINSNSRLLKDADWDVVTYSLSGDKVSIKHHNYYGAEY